VGNDSQLSGAEVATVQSLKVTLLLALVIDVSVRIAREPAEPIRPVLIIRIAFLVTLALGEFSRDVLKRTLRILPTLEVQFHLDTSDQVPKPGNHQSTWLRKHDADRSQDYRRYQRQN
jgi:hypothetical protein